MQLRINSELINDVKLAIFDKDGTLMDLYNYWSNMIGFRVSIAQKKLGLNDAQKKQIMYAMGVDLDKEELRPEGPVGLKRREIVMQAMIDSLAEIGFPRKKDFCFEMFKEADEFSLDHLPEIIRPIKGMHELINDLHTKACKIAIATTDKTERAKLAMKLLGIAGKIDIVVGADLVDNCKPDPDMINLILKKTNIGKENAVMVGDAITDVEMGKNAGLAASIGVCSGLTPKAELLKATKYVIEDISEIAVN